MGAAAASPTGSSSDATASATGDAAPARVLAHTTGVAAAVSLLLLGATLALIA